MAEQPLCSECGERQGDPRGDGLCFECSMAPNVEEHFFGGTDTQWLNHATDEEIRQYCDPGS